MDSIFGKEECNRQDNEGHKAKDGECNECSQAEERVDLVFNISDHLNATELALLFHGTKGIVR